MKYIIVAVMLFGCGDMRPPVQPPTVEDKCGEIADMFIDHWVLCYDLYADKFCTKERVKYIKRQYIMVRKDAVKYCVDKSIRRETPPNPTRCNFELSKSYCSDLWSTWNDWCWEDVK